MYIHDESVLGSVKGSLQRFRGLIGSMAAATATANRRSRSLHPMPSRGGKSPRASQQATPSPEDRTPKTSTEEAERTEKGLFKKASRDALVVASSSSSSSTVV